MPASLTDLFDTALDPLAVLNRDGTIALANAGFERVLGHPPLELMGVDFPGLFHRTDRDRARTALTRLARDAEAMQVDGRITHGDGGFRWTTWSLRLSPGGTVYASGRDESIRRQIEAAVRKRERRNRAMLDHAADVLVVVDRQLIITDANATAAAILGLSRHVLKGRHLAEVAPGLPPASLGALQDGDGLTIDTSLRTATGESIQVEVRFEAFSFEDESMIVGLARDVRERNVHAKRLHQLNQALQDARDSAQAANDAKTSFVTQMSHALRTPLGAILGYSEILIDEADRTSRHDLERIHAAADQLLDLVDDVLDLERIEAGQLALSVDYVELEPLATELVDTLRPLTPKEPAVTLHSEVRAIEVDRSRLIQMLLNLLTYAAHRSPRAPVELRIRDWDELHLVFEVVHHGGAPTADDLSLAFQPFATEETPSDGTGLGLAIARQIALSMGGTLEAVPLDDGLRLSVVLPQSSSR